MDIELSKIKEIVKKADRIVFLGGAGVSTASGIPDFRSPEGLYNIRNNYGVSYEEMLSHTYFYEHMDQFYEFYWNTMVAKNALPNKAHKALAKFENSGKFISILTQNIDGLHQDAGSKRVYELHGSVRRYYCEDCMKFHKLDDIKQNGIPHCSKCGGILKPDVVLYEEPLTQAVIEGAIIEMKLADVLIVGGTSLNVYPAAGLIYDFGGSTSILINKEPTPMDARFDYVIRGDIGEVLEELLG
ncbi:MAG: NAD-dependent protein deacylase [Bacilli bacterium]|nr:NAD-dependent protein deacylase [Bacilli bacterium]